MKSRNLPVTINTPIKINNVAATIDKDSGSDKNATPNKMLNKARK